MTHEADGSTSPGEGAFRGACLLPPSGADGNGEVCAAGALVAADDTNFEYKSYVMFVAIMMSFIIGMVMGLLLGGRLADRGREQRTEAAVAAGAVVERTEAAAAAGTVHVLETEPSCSSRCTSCEASSGSTA